MRSHRKRLGPASLPGNFYAEAFPIKASDHSGVIAVQTAFALHALLRELQRFIRKRFGIASQRRHIHRLGPTVGYTVVHPAAAGHSHDAPAAYWMAPASPRATES